jgi:hypothetical protein
LFDLAITLVTPSVIASARGRDSAAAKLPIVVDRDNFFGRNQNLPANERRHDNAIYLTHTHHITFDHHRLCLLSINDIFEKRVYIFLSQV